MAKVNLSASFVSCHLRNGLSQDIQVLVYIHSIPEAQWAMDCQVAGHVFFVYIITYLYIYIIYLYLYIYIYGYYVKIFDYIHTLV